MRHGPIGVSFASAATVVRPVLALFLPPWIQDSPFPLFLAAVMVSTWLGGLGPGILATIFGAIGGTYFFLSESLSSEVVTATGVVRLIVYTLVAVLISWLNE